MTICGPQGRSILPPARKSITSRQRRPNRLLSGAKLDTEEAEGLQIGSFQEPNLTIYGPQGRYFVPFRDKSITSRQRRQIRLLSGAKIVHKRPSGPLIVGFTYLWSNLRSKIALGPRLCTLFGGLGGIVWRKVGGGFLETFVNFPNAVSLLHGRPGIPFLRFLSPDR